MQNEIKKPFVKKILRIPKERECVDIKQRKKELEFRALLLCPDQLPQLQLLTSKNSLGEMNSFYRFLCVSSADPTQGWSVALECDWNRCLQRSSAKQTGTINVQSDLLVLPYFGKARCVHRSVLGTKEMSVWAEEMRLMTLGAVAEFKATRSEEPNFKFGPSDTCKNQEPASFTPHPHPCPPKSAPPGFLKNCVMYSEEVWREEVGTRPQDSNPEYSGKAARPIQQG